MSDIWNDPFHCGHNRPCFSADAAAANSMDMFALSRQETPVPIVNSACVVAPAEIYDSVCYLNLASIRLHQFPFHFEDV